MASSWMLDPQDPVLTVFELDPDGIYRQVAEVKGDEPFVGTRPFDVRIVPGQLLSRLDTG